MNIRQIQKSDIEAIVQLYRRVASVPGGLARLEHEIDIGYVENFVVRAIGSGVGLVAIDQDGSCVAEIHALCPGIFSFSHILSELTIAVEPEIQGRGVGREIFTRFLREVEQNHPKILRVELIVRESNRQAIQFYESLNFVREGLLKDRIRTMAGDLQADVPMAWRRA